jgi:reductive dehalogenase
MRLYSTRRRPVHLGPFPLETLARTDAPPELGRVPPMQTLRFDASAPVSIVPAIGRFQAMFDLVRDGAVQAAPAEIPDDPAERSRHLKAAGYYFDASMVGICALPAPALLTEPIRNPEVAALGAELERSQPKSFAAGLDMILADVLDSARRSHGPIAHHGHAIVLLVEHPRDPRPDEAGCEWIHGAQPARAAVTAAAAAVLLSTYLRLLGHEARAHSASCSEVDLNRLAVGAGLAATDLNNPFVGRRYGLAAVTTTLALAPDAPLAASAAPGHPRPQGPAGSRAPRAARGASTGVPFARREFRLGPHPFETLRRKAEPTTFIDHARVPRFPKRADFFARALFGDLGPDVQADAKNAHYVMKSPIGACARRALGALLLLQFGDARAPVSPTTADARRNADNLKATSYWLGIDAAAICAVPDWAWYSHDAGGNELPTYHANALNLLVDQGHETMEGASGDDWISVAQSMRAYLRFSLLGGIVAEQIRRLGWSARVHSVLDGDVLQPPLLLLSGLGEVSRIGEVILNPFLGPRLKSGAVTTDMPMAADAPIDFGLQRFCEQCQKCARECPSGAITAGPKLVYNGYEIWKSDAEKCARYRITNAGGGMCGRCMKTCPWNLEGLFAEAPFRWAAMHLPAAAPWLARLDDALDRGSINPLKKWWWDIELDRTSGRYVRAKQTHARTLQKDLVLKAEDQVLAVYPADRMPPPWPVAWPVNRAEGIARYRALLTPAQYRQRLARGETDGLAPQARLPDGEPPVFAVRLVRRTEMTPDIARYEFEAEGGGDLPAFEPGAHVDVVIAPEYLRPFSLAGDPADRKHWVLGVLAERAGRGGSALMHRAFREGRRVFVGRPRNHFPLHEAATQVLLFAGGIGVTPLIAMAHRLHALGRPFELHYSAASRAQAGFVDTLQQAPWAGRVHWHFRDEGGRADLPTLVPPFTDGRQLYACGSARYMDAVFDAARGRGWPEQALHREYFHVPEAPPREDHPFRLRLLRSRRTLPVPAGRSATAILAEAGLAVPTKCSDGLCGVCATGYDATQSGAVDHRDHVLDDAARQRQVILCCARMQQAGAVLAVDL